MPALGKLDVCVLNSTAIVDRSKDFLSKYEKVHAFLDNDAPGRGALGKIRSFLPCYDFPFFLPSSFSVFQSFNPLFLHPFPCAYARALALLTRV